MTELVSGACQHCGKVHREPQPGSQTDLLDWYIKGAAVPGANGLICHKHQADIAIGGGLWDKARQVFGADLRPSAVRMREGAKMDAVWPATGRSSPFATSSKRPRDQAHAGDHDQPQPSPSRSAGVVGGG